MTDADLRLLELADDEPADLAELLADTEEYVRRYVVLSAAQVCGVALWVAHTHAIEAAEATPYLAVTSPEKRSGKTRLLEVLELVAAGSLRASSMSEAYLFRSLAEHRRTILLDELDAIFGARAEREDLRALINAGYRRGAVVGRCETVGRQIVTRDYDAFAAKALAGIGELPDTIADRAIPIRLQRRHRGETVARSRIREATPVGHAIRDALAAVLTDPETLDELRRARPELPEALDDRAQDGWEPLLAIADLAGGDWPARARAAAAEIHGTGTDADESAGVLVLRHIRELLDGRDYISTADLLEALTSREDGPWGAWWGPDVEAGRTRGPASRLARLLRPYGIRPGKVGPEDTRVQGYRRAQYLEAWSRYLDGDDTPPDPPSGAQSDPSLPLSIPENGQMDSRRSEPVSTTPTATPNTPTDQHLSDCPTLGTDRGREKTDTALRGVVALLHGEMGAEPVADTPTPVDHDPPHRAPVPAGDDPLERQAAQEAVYRIVTEFGWPRVELGPATKAGGSEAAWRRFIANASLADLRNALDALSDHEERIAEHNHEGAFEEGHDETGAGG